MFRRISSGGWVFFFCLFDANSRMDKSGLLFVSRDWLPAALMPMVYWQAGRFSSMVNKSFQKRLKRLDDRLLRLSCYVLVPLGLGVLYLARMRTLTRRQRVTSLYP